MTVMVAAAGLLTASAAPFVVAGVLGGHGRRRELEHAGPAVPARPTERAGLLALVEALSWTAAALPNLIAGRVAGVAGLLALTARCAGLVLVGLVVVLVRARPLGSATS